MVHKLVERQRKELVNQRADVRELEHTKHHRLIDRRDEHRRRGAQGAAARGHNNRLRRHLKRRKREAVREQQRRILIVVRQVLGPVIRLEALIRVFTGERKTEELRLDGPALHDPLGDAVGQINEPRVKGAGQLTAVQRRRIVQDRRNKAHLFLRLGQLDQVLGHGRVWKSFVRRDLEHPCIHIRRGQRVAEVVERVENSPETIGAIPQHPAPPQLERSHRRHQFPAHRRDQLRIAVSVIGGNEPLQVAERDPEHIERTHNPHGRTAGGIKDAAGNRSERGHTGVGKRSLQANRDIFVRNTRVRRLAQPIPNQVYQIVPRQIRRHNPPQTAVDRVIQPQLKLVHHLD